MTERVGRTGTDRSYPYELMREQQHALEQQHADFRWGPYGIKVARFHLATFPPGKIDQFHKHSEEFEFHFVPRGKGMVILVDQPFNLSEGMMYVTGPQVVHYQEADAEEAMEELCLRIRIVRLEQSAPDRSWGARSEWDEAEQCVRQLSILPLRPVNDRFRAMECFLSAYRAWYENQPGLHTHMKHCIIQILLRVARTYFPEAQQPLPSRDMNQFRFKLAEQFMKDNYQQPLTLDEVAGRIHISPRQLQRIFKAQADATFTGYIEHIRLAHVQADLEQGQDTVEALAVRHGFSSANYLHRIFKRSLGMTPLQYRASKQN